MSRIIGIFIILSLIFGVYNLAAEGIYKANKNEVMQVITVKEKDTLWSIAKRYDTVEKDIRKTVYRIKELNDLTDQYIYPGQELVVPVRADIEEEFFAQSSGR